MFFWRGGSCFSLSRQPRWVGPKWLNKEKHRQILPLQPRWVGRNCEKIKTDTDVGYRYGCTWRWIVAHPPPPDLAPYRCCLVADGVFLLKTEKFLKRNWQVHRQKVKVRWKRDLKKCHITKYNEQIYKKPKSKKVAWTKLFTPWQNGSEITCSVVPRKKWFTFPVRRLY